MIRVMMRGCRRIIFVDYCGQGHPVLIYIDNKLECSGFEKKVEMIMNDI